MPRSAHFSTGQDPEIGGEHPPPNHATHGHPPRLPRRVVAAREQPRTVRGMWDRTYSPAPAPPLGRLWDDDDVAAFTGFRSIDELIARNPAFPAPLDLGMQGRRWHPQDVYDWVESLRTAPRATRGAETRAKGARLLPADLEIPELDLSAIPELTAQSKGA